MIGSGIGSVGKAQRQTNEVFRYPSPIGGVDIRNSLDSGALSTCLYAYNIAPYEQGMQVREGYREHQIGVDAGSGAGVHTLIPFNSVNDDTTGNALFAVTNEGIWNVTAQSGTPSLDVTFADQSVDAGYGTFTHYVNQAETDVLFYADNINGLFSYDAATTTWTNTGIVTGINEVDVKFVMSHKNNVWFAVKNSTTGYYLPILSSTGTVTAQYFGDKFQHGGTLAGLFSWTVDGGQGVDDILVVVSQAGDVILYTGSGPTETDWGMKGVYYVGKIPNTPRFGSEQGGELRILSAYGVMSMNDLLQGVDTSTLRADAGTGGMAYKIAGLIREDMKTKINSRGWDISLIPSEGGVLINTPTVVGESPIQFYYNLATQGWGLWRDVPMLCFTEYADAVVFGTSDGRVMVMDSPVDDALITPPVDGLNGNEIPFSVLTAYHPLSSAGTYKRVKLIRPDFISTLPPSHSSQARYDFDTSEGVDFQLREPSAFLGGVWGTGTWDNAVWGSADGVTFPTIGGAWGTGRYVAIATRGTCRAKTQLLGWDVVFDTGGTLR